jgi:hypothetical protein
LLPVTPINDEVCEGSSEVMKKLANPDWDPSLPVQTKLGARQALLVGHNKIDELIRSKILEVVYTGRIAKITTRSILAYAARGDGPPKRGAGKTAKAPTERA